MRRFLCGREFAHLRGKTPRNVVTGSCGKTKFGFVRSRRAAFRRGRTAPRPRPSPRRRVPSGPGSRPSGGVRSGVSRRGLHCPDGARRGACFARSFAILFVSLLRRGVCSGSRLSSCWIRLRPGEFGGAAHSQQAFHRHLSRTISPHLQLVFSLSSRRMILNPAVRYCYRYFLIYRQQKFVRHSCDGGKFENEARAGSLVNFCFRFMDSCPLAVPSRG